MALKYPWFKFAPTDWVMGKIQRCPEITQARFIRLCCLYWNKECVLSIEDSIIEIDKDHLDLLLDKKIIKSDSTFIKIDFLDEQNDSCGENSERKRLAALARWSKNNPTELQNDADAMHVHTDAMQNDADRKIDKKDRQNEFDIFWSKYPNKTGKKPAKEKFLKLNDSDISSILSSVDAFASYKPFKDYIHPHATTYLNQRRWEDEKPTVKNESNDLPPITRDVWHIAKQIPAERDRICKLHNLSVETFNTLFK